MESKRCTSVVTHRLYANRLALSSVKVVGGSGQLLKVDVGTDGHLPGVNLHDPGAGLLVGMRELDLAIQTAGPEQGGVKDVHTVGGSNHLYSTHRTCQYYELQVARPV